MHRLADDNEDNAPFQICLWESKPNSYTAQSPLLTGELSPGIAYCSETLPSFT